MKIIYAMYDDNEILAKGTIKEIAVKLGLKEASVRYYRQPSMRNKNHGRRLVEVERIKKKQPKRIKIGTAVQSILKTLGLDHKSFGQLTGIHQDTVYQWLVSKSRPSSKTMQKMRSVEAVYKAYPDFFDHPERFEVGGELIEEERYIKKRNRVGSLTDFDMEVIQLIEARYESLTNAPKDDPLFQFIHKKFSK